jgi:hypothetical protein
MSSPLYSYCMTTTASPLRPSASNVLRLLHSTSRSPKPYFLTRLQLNSVHIEVYSPACNATVKWNEFFCKKSTWLRLVQADEWTSAGQAVRRSCTPVRSGYFGRRPRRVMSSTHGKRATLTLPISSNPGRWKAHRLFLLRKNPKAGGTAQRTLRSTYYWRYYTLPFVV